MVECWEQDGYRVARPEYFSDSQPPAASEAQANLQTLCQSVDQLASVWLDKVRYAIPVCRLTVTVPVSDELSRTGLDKVRYSLYISKLPI